MIDRKLRKTLRATLLAMSDAALAYVRDESDKEWKRRRDKVRERRRARQQQGGRGMSELPEMGKMLEDLGKVEGLQPTFALIAAALSVGPSSYKVVTDRELEAIRKAAEPVGAFTDGL